MRLMVVEEKVQLLLGSCGQVWLLVMSLLGMKQHCTLWIAGI
jgi:hypothetical protein